MKVYRLEYGGYGVFCDAAGYMTNTEDALYKNYGCTIRERMTLGDELRFGCETLDKLIEYFGSDFGILLDIGAHIMEYEVHKAHVLYAIETRIEVAFKVDKVKSKHIMYRKIKEGVQDGLQITLR